LRIVLPLSWVSLLVRHHVGMPSTRTLVVLVIKGCYAVMGLAEARRLDALIDFLLLVELINQVFVVGQQIVNAAFELVGNQLLHR